jgi:DNA polymerase-3 subunit epsilon
MSTLYAVIDVETTGGRVGEEGVTEIAVFLFDGHEIVDQFITLVNPERPIQPFVQQLTGITPKMVARAPKFPEIAKRLVQMTEGAVFVAHNAPFDYRMIQDEFGRLGYDYERKTLDTIPLARRLIPGLKSYGLDALCTALNISNTSRHRADGDARATVELLRILLAKDREKSIEGLAIDQSLGVRGDHRFTQQIKQYRDTTGVYYLYNAQGKVLYVGQSDRLRNKIDRHFLATNEKAEALQNEVATIQVEETGSLALAKMLEHLALKKLKPPYNKPKDRYALSTGLFWIPTDDGMSGTFDVRPVHQQKPRLYVQRTGHGRDWATAWEAHTRPTQTTWTEDEAWDSLLGMVLPSNALVLDKGRRTGETTVFWVENGQLRGYAWVQLASHIQANDVLRHQLAELPESTYLHGVLMDAIRWGGLEVRAW